MRILFDTSVLIAAMVELHPFNSKALPWLERAKAKEFEFLISIHTLAELFAVLSRLSTKPRISPGIAWRLIHDNIESTAIIISLTPSEYCQTIKKVSEKGISGGIIYDALIAKAAQKSKADRLLTFNIRDFEKIWDGNKSVLCLP